MLTVGTQVQTRSFGYVGEIIAVVPPGGRTKDRATNTTETVWYQIKFADASTMWALREYFVEIEPTHPLVADTECAELNDVVLLLNSGRTAHHFAEGSVGIVIDIQPEPDLNQRFAIVEQHILDGHSEYRAVWQIVDHTEYAVVQVPSA